MIRLAVIGLGKMGISHLAIANSHPDVLLVAACDSNAYVSSMLNKYAGIRVFANYREVLAGDNLDAVIIATPPRSHGEMVREALDHGLHVFCEKPFCLDARESAELAFLARDRRLVNQVGYHCRFVGTFREAKRLIVAGVLGRIHHIRAEAYGPVVLRPTGTSWRLYRRDGGGCLRDYACHAIDLIIYLVGAPDHVSGTVTNQIFSHGVEDEVYTTLHFSNGITGQLSSNWSDASYRKMSTTLTIWGTNGRLCVDRQQVQLFLRDYPSCEPALKQGWNIKFTTELTSEVWYYLRGEEYSAQLDHFIRCIKTKQIETDSSFASAAATDRIVSMMLEEAVLATSKMNERRYSFDQQRGVPKSGNRMVRRAKAMLRLWV